MPVQVPNEYWALGIGEITDIIKAIVSTTDFDVRRLTQKDLDLPDPRTFEQTRGNGDLGTLERLMERVQTRHMGGGAAKRIDDWRTLQVTLTTARPLPAQRLEAGRARR